MERGDNDMAKEIYMPKFGMSMLEGEVARWIVKEGDKVSKGDDIAEITENKATHTIQALVSGTVDKIVVKEGETTKVGEVIAMLKD